LDENGEAVANLRRVKAGSFEELWETARSSLDECLDDALQ
jgi:hypothetical protein